MLLNQTKWYLYFDVLTSHIKNCVIKKKNDILKCSYKKIPFKLFFLSRLKQATQNIDSFATNAYFFLKFLTITYYIIAYPISFINLPPSCTLHLLNSFPVFPLVQTLSRDVKAEERLVQTGIIRQGVGGIKSREGNSWGSV